jgi:hypothetical protein
VTATEPIKYVDYDPPIPGHVATSALHVHVRTTDRCVKNATGEPCLTPPELRDEVKRLRRWKDEAAEVILGLQDLGKALGVPLGTRITGDGAAKIAERLVAERYVLQQRLDNARALVLSWRRGTVTEYGQAVDQCRNAVLAVLDGPAAPPQEPHLTPEAGAGPLRNEPAVDGPCDCGTCVAIAEDRAARQQVEEPYVERITDDNGDELERGADTDAPAMEAHPTTGPVREPRLKACVEAWPECYEGGYDPACCRFPKSCSADVYDLEHVTDDQLEYPHPARQHTGGQPT